MRFLRRSLVGLFLLSLTVGILAWAGNTFYEALADPLGRGKLLPSQRANGCLRSMS